MLYRTITYFVILYHVMPWSGLVWSGQVAVEFLQEPSAAITVYLCISVFLYWCASALVAELPHLSLHRTALSAGDDSTNTAHHFDLWSIKPF